MEALYEEAGLHQPFAMLPRAGSVPNCFGLTYTPACTDGPSSIADHNLASVGYVDQIPRIVSRPRQLTALLELHQLSMPFDEGHDTACSTLQVALAMHLARRDGKSLQYAAARMAMWLLSDVYAHLEALIFPEASLRTVCSIWR